MRERSATGHVPLMGCASLAHPDDIAAEVRRARQSPVVTMRSLMPCLTVRYKFRQLKR
jgi:hypothetical protein